MMKIAFVIIKNKKDDVRVSVFQTSWSWDYYTGNGSIKNSSQKFWYIQGNFIRIIIRNHLWFYILWFFRPFRMTVDNVLRIPLSTSDNFEQRTRYQTPQQEKIKDSWMIFNFLELKFDFSEFPLWNVDIIDILENDDDNDKKIPHISFGFMYVIKTILSLEKKKKNSLSLILEKRSIIGQY